LKKGEQKNPPGKRNGEKITGEKGPAWDKAIPDSERSQTRKKGHRWKLFGVTEKTGQKPRKKTGQKRGVME